MILLDSNIVIDLLEGDGAWSGWSRGMLARHPDEELAVSVIVAAGTTGQFAYPKEQASYFTDLRARVMPLSAPAAWYAGQAFAAYRRAGGPRSAILADFLIGGHAVSLGATLMTRDRQRFAGYFPDLSLLTPETHP